MQFAYQVRDTSGRIRAGEIGAETMAEAARQLRNDGLYLLSLDAEENDRGGFEFDLFKKRITRGDIIYLTNQLAVMVDAGVPLANALEGLAKQAENPSLKSAISKIQSSVQAGDDLSTALARFPKLFDATYVNLVKASESSGTLAEMLERIADRARADLETMQKVRGALAYPAIMLLMCASASIFLLTYVFPKLTPMFEMRSIALPAPTQFMIALSTSLRMYWYWWVAAIGSIASFVWYARSKPWGRSAIDCSLLYIPVVGPLMRKVAISRSLHTLATTLNAGVPTLESIELCANVAKNVHYMNAWLAVVDEVAAGRQIHEALEGSPLFPSTLLQMIASGEATGKLGHVLNKIGKHFDHDVSNSVKSATTLIEPIMVLVMGAVIGVIALAMLLPIFSLSGSPG